MTNETINVYTEQRPWSSFPQFQGLRPKAVALHLLFDARTVSLSSNPSAFYVVTDASPGTASDSTGHYQETEGSEFNFGLGHVLEFILVTVQLPLYQRARMILSL